MRITGGETRGRTLRFPSGSKERPTSDFLREALFNILGSLQEKTFLDLFAGSGSVGLEAASRGAEEIYFAEKNKELVAVIKKNVQECSFDKNCRIVAGDIELGLRDLFRKEYKFDIIFADPPYNRNLAGETLKLLSKYQLLKKDGVIVIQHSIKEKFSEFINDNFYQADQRKYGDNALTFLKREFK
ncbi:MAG: 16S rRNA (guanine(966)-N(2))-methyltransferase RsmD [Deltaproteobacteria bacterium]|nr:16S rRNA (guanine(966)-N(2))-methyltransferase RsmD [Deltaproteobacteria bacterium]